MLIKRTTEGSGNDLRTTYRPCTLEEYIGGESLKRILYKQILEGTLSHTVLISGPSGCGKTTLARIIALMLNCEKRPFMSNPMEPPCLVCHSCASILNRNSLDYQEINVGSNSGKADVDDIISGLANGAFSAQHKIIVFDECHKLTPAAKDLLLKPTEDTYEHVYLIFCTNQPEKLLDTKKNENPFLDRCAHFKVEPLNQEEMFNALENVCQFEGVPYTPDILKYIADTSLGIPRRALKELSAVMAEGTWQLDNVKRIIEGVTLPENDPEIMDLSKVMLEGKIKATYSKFEALSKKHEVEAIRVAVCGFLVWRLKSSENIPYMSKLTRILNYFTIPILSTGTVAKHTFYNYLAKTLTILKSS